MNIAIPAELLPHDGRFGSGPSRQRPGQVEAVIARSASFFGTSHRKPAVKNVVHRIREGLTELFHAPDGYEVILGNGGASLVWDALAFTGVESQALAAISGEFSGKAAKAVNRVPWASCATIASAPGERASCETREGIDSYFYAHNETSTMVLTPVERFGASPAALTFVDGTSAAGGVSFDIANTDLYYFSPQKCFGADGGLWLAIASPAALERFARLAEQRWIPDILNLHIAATNSAANQTLNTPSLINLALIADQIEWMLSEGGLAAMDERTRAASSVVYNWAEASTYATPFVAPEARSCVGATIDLADSVSSETLRGHLRANGIVDIDPYRSLGRNQLRIGTFPNVTTSDAEALTRCVDYVVERM